MMHYYAKPLEQTWKVTSFTCSWLWIQYRLLNRLLLIMLWEKQSAAAGLGGLMPREAAKGKFQLDCFQNMDDPLPDPDATLGPLIKDISFDLI